MPDDTDNSEAGDDGTPVEYVGGSSRSDVFSEADRETFREAVETWGWEPQVDMATEEAGELIVALSRYMRGRNDEEDVVDELADVRIMCEQLTEFIGREQVEEHVSVKMNRLRERLEENDA